MFDNHNLVGWDISVGQQLATDWTVRGSNHDEANFTAPVETGPGAHPAYYKIRTGSFPRIKRPGRGAEYPLPSSNDVKETVELYLYIICVPSWPVLG